MIVNGAVFQVQLVCDELYGKEADYVDWKHFLVCAAQPWPLPLPHQLLNTLGRFQVTVGKDKMANRQQYMAVRLWLEDEEMEGERGESRFNRMEKLKEFLFDLFSDNENQLDYTKMVGGMALPTSNVTSWTLPLYTAAVPLCGPQPRAGPGQGS